jgi:KaiC/GvpD/RAD55 family RecA-like ATPase
VTDAANSRSGRPRFPDLPPDWKHVTEVDWTVGCQRLRTGIPSLDDATAGGVAVGVVTTLQGKPGVGKSTFASQLALRFEQDHHALVVALCPDEGRELADMRMAEQLGFDRRLLEQFHPDERVRWGQACTRSIWLPDPEEHGNTVEAVSERLRRLYAYWDGERPAVLLVDSVQVVRCDAANGEDHPRLRTIATMRALKRAAESIPAVVIAVSKVNRGSYRSRKPSENTSDLAAGAESSEIEYASRLLIHLDGGSCGPVMARVAKNSLTGLTPAFALRLNPATKTFTEVDAASVEEAAEVWKERERQARIGKLADETAALLAKHGTLNVREIADRISGHRRGDVLDALNSLEAQGLAEWVPGPHRSKVWALKVRGGVS